MNSAEVQCVDNALAGLTPGLLPGLIGKVGNFDAKQLSAALSAVRCPSLLWLIFVCKGDLIDFVLILLCSKTLICFDDQSVN